MRDPLGQQRSKGAKGEALGSSLCVLIWGDICRIRPSLIISPPASLRRTVFVPEPRRAMPGRPGRRLIIVNESGELGPRGVFMMENSPRGSRAGRRDVDPWASFWVSMLASIIQSTDEDLAESLVTMFGSETESAAPKLEVLTAEEFDGLKDVEFLGEGKSAAAKTEYPLVSAKADEGQNSCIICMCDYQDHMILKQAPCGHFFHESCLRTWLMHRNTTYAGRPLPKPLRPAN